MQKHVLFFCLLLPGAMSFAQPLAPLNSDTVSWIQALMRAPDSSYWKISDLAETWFATTHDSIDPHFAKMYARWAWFWNPRVDSSGNRNTLNEYLLSVESTEGGVCEENGNWTQLGPVVTTSQVSGIVTAVYAPSTDSFAVPDTIYAGSNTGGLWKTTNGGQNWSCMTDVLRMPALGINSIVGDPVNKDVIYIATAHTCPSTISNGINIPLGASMIAELINRYDSAELAFANLLFNYNQVIDGGSTTALLSQLQLNWSQDAWQLREELLTYSPYLSEEVLRETADQDVLPPAMLLEICLANPEGTKNDGFIDFLETEIPSPLPSYMLDLIVANWDSTTARTLLELGLARFGSEMAFTSNMLVMDLKFDTLDQQDSIRYWFRRRGTMDGQYALAESFAAAEMFDSALSVLAAIPDSFDLERAGLEAAHDDYVDWVTFQQTIDDDDRTLMMLDSAEVVDLQAMAENTVGPASVMAWNLLCFGYDLCRDYPPASEEGNNARRADPRLNARDLIRSEYYKLKVYPNPAGLYATFEWDLIHLEGEVGLRILDTYGREVAQYLITTQKGHWLWDTREVPDGIYLYELRTEAQEVLAQGKIVVQK